MRNRFKAFANLVTCTVLFLASCFAPSSSHAEMLVSHIGNTDPDSENWNPNSAVYFYLDYVTSLIDNGTPAFAIKGYKMTSQINYYYGVDTNDVAKARSLGWKLRWKHRVSDTGGIPAYEVGYSDGQNHYAIRTGADSNGILYVQSWSPDWTINTNLPTTNGTYHLFELTAPTGGPADLYVDGTKVLSNFVYLAIGYKNPRIEWKSVAPYGIGYFAFIDFQIAPLESNLKINASAPVTIALENLKPGSTNVLYGSSDLVDWNPVATNIPDSTTAQLVLPMIESGSNRFFRVQSN